MEVNFLPKRDHCKICRKVLKKGQLEYCSDFCELSDTDKCEMCGHAIEQDTEFKKSRPFCNKCQVIINSRNKAIFAGKHPELLRRDYMKENYLQV